MSPMLVERILISLVFGLSGLAKLAGLDFEVEAFARWGFPEGSMYAVGIFELLGALGIWIDRMSAFVGLCLCGLATGALLIQLVFGSLLPAAITAAVLVMVIHYTWKQRDELFPSDRDGPDASD